MGSVSPSDVPSPVSDGTLELSDGRRLGYAEYGPSDGDPVLFCHGTPGSRYTRFPGASTLDELGVRQITLERPGFGRSTFDADREILDWPADVREAADALGYDRFAVVGYSGGGPFALACAARIPDRLTSAGVVSGVGPLGAPGATDGMALTNRIGFRFATVPFLLRLPLWFRIRKIRSDTDGFIDAWADSAVGPDRQILRRPAVRAVIRENFPEAVRQGTKGPLYETRLHATPWGFDLADVSLPVDLWHGERDTMAPDSMADHVIGELPHCTAHMYADEGHLLIYDYWAEILSTLQQD